MRSDSHSLILRIGRAIPIPGIQKAWPRVVRFPDCHECQVLTNTQSRSGNLTNKRVDLVDTLLC